MSTWQTTKVYIATIALKERSACVDLVTDERDRGLLRWTYRSLRRAGLSESMARTHVFDLLWIGHCGTKQERHREECA